jgi:cobalt/nickel transport system ATP-binding protein
VRKGERVVIIGPNGCGKTTLLFHVLGLLAPDEGSVQVFGCNPAKEFDKIRKRIGVVLQNVDEQLISPTVEEDISFAPRNYGLPEDEVARLVDDAMRQLGISHIRKKLCHYLSGGEKRKVALAGSIVLRPELLVLDEPFEGLDPVSRRELIGLLNRLSREWGMAIIMSTHDINIVSRMADFVYVLGQKGQILIKDTPADIFARTEYYHQARLDFPILVELFNELKDKGLELENPADIEDAAEQIKRLVEKNSRK